MFYKEITDNAEINKVGQSMTQRSPCTTYGNNLPNRGSFYTKAGGTLNREESPGRTVSAHTTSNKSSTHRGIFI